MQLEEKHIAALDKAEALIFHSDFCPYLELKDLFSDASPLARARFRILFTSYYGLNTGGLTDEFKDRYFAILFSEKVIVNGLPDFRTILTELSGLKRKKGDFAIPFSFVSKLVTIHRESSPIYDRHVVAFFREKVSATKLSKIERIGWFVGFLDGVAENYRAWARDERVVSILNRFCSRDPRLKQCDDVRLIDFLVWKVGNQKLLST